MTPTRHPVPARVWWECDVLHHHHSSFEEAVQCEESRPEPSVIEAKVWVCDQCATSGEWGERWMWFGSWKQWEDRGLPGVKDIETYCSEECAHRAHPTRPIDILDDLAEVR